MTAVVCDFTKFAADEVLRAETDLTASPMKDMVWLCSQGGRERNAMDSYGEHYD